MLLLNERDEWELPGGRIEPGESTAIALVREIFEELRIEVKVAGPLDSYVFEVIPTRHVIISTYSCEATGPFRPALSLEHRELGLFAPEALPANLPSGYRRSILRSRQKAARASTIP